VTLQKFSLTFVSFYKRRIPAKNVSEDIRKKFNSAWWRICKEGNENEVQKYLALGGETLTYTRDMNSRRYFFKLLF